MNKSALIFKTPKGCHSCRFYFVREHQGTSWCRAFKEDRYIDDLYDPYDNPPLKKLRMKWCPLADLREVNDE